MSTEDAPRPTALDGLLAVDLGGVWHGLAVQRLEVRDGELVSTDIDGQFVVEFGVPLRYLGLSVELEGAYAGDRFCLYYSCGRAYTEDTTVVLEPKAGANRYLLAFDTPVVNVRIDPIERKGETGIVKLDLVGAKDEQTARRLLVEAAGVPANAAVSEIPVTCDPERRDAMAHYTPKAIKGEVRSRGRLRRSVPRTPSSVQVIIDPQPNFIDPDDELLSASAREACRGVFGAEPSVATASLGQADPAALTLCIAQTAFQASMAKMAWKVPPDIRGLRNVCFMSAGSAVLGLPGEHGRKPTKRSAALIRLFFAGPWLHGVRDAYTARLLDAAGASNYVVVGTPSLWDVERDLGEQIPETKGQRVLFVADENYRDPKNDIVALRRLGEVFDEVALWPSDAPEAEDYARRLVRHAGIQSLARFLDGGLAALDAYLAQPGTDYVGADLEAGIRALKARRRTLILTGDDRSSGVAELCALPAMRRIEVADALRRWLAEPHETRLSIPREEIGRWRSQFS